MSFSVQGNSIIADSTFETELVKLCELYPDLHIVAAHPDRAGSASLFFFMNLPLDIRRSLVYADTRWEVTFANGSNIRFISFNEGAKSSVPDAPVHVFVNYGIKNLIIIRNMAQVMQEYDGVIKKEHKNIFPIYKENDFIFAGKGFHIEMERIQERITTKGVKGYSIPTLEPDVSKYAKAQEVLDEEAKVMRIYEDDLLQQRKAELELKKKIRDKKRLRMRSYY